MLTTHTRETLIAFELRMRAVFEAGELPFHVHFSGGNEGQLLDIFRDVKAGDWIFSTHRNHYHALLAGVSEERLEKLIRDGRSMFVFDRAAQLLTSSVLAGTCCIAAGVALALQQAGSTSRVWCFLGDGAEEEGHLYEAALFVTAQRLPCEFLIEDNGRSADTPLSVRRGSAKGLEHLFPCVRRHVYTATYPHAGVGLTPDKWVTFRPEIVARHMPSGSAH
jgi:TPP-dependent pyruvate/acetoin dehydrogenase alpha subunit